MPDQKKPDWKNLVRERMESHEPAPTDCEEVVAELAAHLEETYEAAQSQGLNEETALKRTLREVEDWRVLAADIRHAKQEGPMNSRTKNLWLPGAATLLGASVFLMALQRTSFQPRLVWIGHAAMLFYWPWLAGLPVFGAFGAYLSQRAHGPLKARLAAGLSPALVMLVTMCVILPVGLALDGFSMFRLFYFALALANWVVLPAFALLLGAAPFLRETGVSRRPQPHS